jgi:PIN domain nuclease of toxin-antitoxin system
MRLLLDTCAILWAIAEPESLSANGRQSISDPGAEVFVSVISCAEIACAVGRGRIALDRHWKSWFRDYTELNGWQPVPIDLEIMEEAYSLPEYSQRDPVDRIIVATARKLQLHVITADRRILDYPHVETIW